MMMAHDSSAGRPQLSAETVSELTAALRNYAANEADIAALQPALRAVAAEAREKKVQAEQLLVLLKEVWFRLPNTQSTDGDGQVHLQRVVTLCIREYYS
jgi:hypothetical protein